MSFNRIIAASLVAAIGIGTAIACGPNFPWQLLSNRDRTVSDRVELNFVRQIEDMLEHRAAADEFHV